MVAGAEVLMYPVLIRFNGWSVSTLGVLYTLAFLLGFLWSLRRAPRYCVSRATVCDVTILIMLSFLVGSRVYYVLCHWAQFKIDLGSIFKIFRGGTAQYGGVLLSIIALVVYSRLKKISITDLAVTITPPYFLGMAIGRLGCFANGCCFGLPTSSFIGVHYPAWCQASRVARRVLESSANGFLLGDAGNDVFVPAIHPTQLYSAAGALICLGIVLWLERKTADPFIVAVASVGLLGLLRLVVDHFRYYESSALCAGLPINSWISLALLSSALVIRIVHHRDT